MASKMEGSRSKEGSSSEHFKPGRDASLVMSESDAGQEP
jgi:hypothetical protein